MSFLLMLVKVGVVIAKFLFANSLHQFVQLAELLVYRKEGVSGRCAWQRAQGNDGRGTPHSE